MRTTCPRCGTSLERPDDAAPRGVVCPNCGHAFVPAIDVQFEVVSVETSPGKEEPQPRNEWDNPQFSTGGWELPPRSQRPFVYVWRGGNTSGLPCCGCGCLVLLLLGFLIAQGVMRLFQELT